MKVGLLLLLSLTILSAKVIAGEPMDVFFLAVGSGSYITSRESGVQQLYGIPGAAKSANAVAVVLPTSSANSACKSLESRYDRCGDIRGDGHYLV